MNKVKKIFILLLLAGFALLLMGNMAAPKHADVGSSITFEQNENLAVLSENLDIRVSGSKAEIVATYKMKNTTDEAVSTQTMFLSPNVEYGKTKILLNNNEAEFTVQSYSLEYSDVSVPTDDWKYAVLSENDQQSLFDSSRSVDAIYFQMDFAPNEEYDVVVSYTYLLGGYPDANFSVKDGKIYYYLAPAAMWKDFGGITINLYLDKDMPVIKSSNLEFEKIDKRVYRYHSDTLPNENLRIMIDENGWQNFISSFRSPYLLIWLGYTAPAIMAVILIVVLVIVIVRKKKKKTVVGNEKRNKTW